MVRRFSIAMALAALVISLVPGIAAASVDGACSGEASLEGASYGPGNDTPGNAIPIPDKDGVIVTYSGSVGFENKGHSGSAKVQVGPFGITLGEAWDGSNEQDDRGVENQTYALDDFRDKLPIWIPGVWKVTATHSASGGQCSGFAMIKLAGSPLSSAVGWVVLIGLLGLTFVAISAIARKRWFAASFAALFAGVFLALALMMWSIRPLDTLTLVILPIVLAVLAAVAVILLGRNRSLA